MIFSRRGAAGRDSKPSRPVRISVHLHPYGDGRKLLLSRDVTALEQADAMRRDFVANVSHEIRTPLTVLIGFIETLQTLPLSAGADPLPGHDVAASLAHAKRGAGLAHAIPAGRQPVAGHD